MTGRTYRYFKGEALYPFGYGLSYTSFKYDQLKIPAIIAVGKSVSVTVRVVNTGKKDGEEVVQLYVADENTNELAPLKALKGFKRIYLKAGESKMISFILSPADLSIINENGEAHEINGKAMISIGGVQPGLKNKTTSNVVQQIISIN
jgi:beta-glucosidase